MRNNLDASRPAFAIFTETICEGLIPAWHDDQGCPMVYETEIEAQREIASWTIDQLNQFLAGERSFDDAVTVEDFVLPVDVWPDGSISIEDGRHFLRR